MHTRVWYVQARLKKAHFHAHGLLLGWLHPSTRLLWHYPAWRRSIFALCRDRGCEIWAELLEHQVSVRVFTHEFGISFFSWGPNWIMIHDASAVTLSETDNRWAIYIRALWLAEYMLPEMPFVIVPVSLSFGGWTNASILADLKRRGERYTDQIDSLCNVSHRKCVIACLLPLALSHTHPHVNVFFLPNVIQCVECQAHFVCLATQTEKHKKNRNQIKNPLNSSVAKLVRFISEQIIELQRKTKITCFIFHWKKCVRFFFIPFMLSIIPFTRSFAGEMIVATNLL